jgi:hypothetical protein
VIFVRVELDDGNWIELRDADELRTGDKLAVKRALKLPRDENGMIVTTSAITDEQRIAMLGRIITAWSYEGRPIPSEAMSPESAIEQLSIKTYDALCDAIKPHMEAIEYSPSD